MLGRLLQGRPGEAVSLEVLDDVAVIGPDGTTAEQIKSGLAHNPIADRLGAPKDGAKHCVADSANSKCGCPGGRVGRAVDQASIGG